MPFKSKAQRRKFYAMADRGEISKKKVKEWEDATPKGKKLPERVKKEGTMKSAAYAFGEAIGAAPEGMEKEATAWIGRNLIMPALRGLAAVPQKGLKMLPGEWAQRASKGVGKYRRGLRAAAKSPTDADAFLQARYTTPASVYGGASKTRLRAPKPEIGPKKPGPSIYGGAAPVGSGELGGEAGAKLRKFIEDSLNKQKLYGGIGAAAVGIPGIALTMGAISRHRRRKAEQELEEAMNAKSANYSAKAIGLLAGAGLLKESKGAGIVGRGLQRVGETVAPAYRKLVGVGEKVVGSEGRVGRHGKRVEQAIAGAKGGTKLSKGNAKRVAQSAPAGGVPGQISKPMEKKVPYGEKSKKLMRNIGGTTAGGAAAVGAGGGLAIGFGAKGKKKKKKGEKKASLGSPIMDGFLLCCASNGMNATQTADAIEKRAQVDDRVGKECKSFLERVAAYKG